MIISNKNTNKLITKTFYFFLVLHLLCWTLLPYLCRYSVSHDTIEAFVWAQHLDWGYDKNPWLIGWITRFGLVLGGYKSPLGYYFIQQCFIVLGLWSVWQLGQKVTSNLLYALIGALALEGSLYFTAYVHINNDNFILIGLWLFAAYAFFMAISANRFLYWMLVGVSLGCAMMAKYSTVFLLLGMLMYVVYKQQTKAILKNPYAYLAVLLALIIISPNIFWLYKQNFIAFRYAFARGAVTGNNSFWFKHIYMSLGFLTNFFAGLIPVLVLVLMGGKPRWKIKASQHLDYLMFIGLMPFVMVLLIAVIAGMQIYEEWMAPFIGLWGLICIVLLAPQESFRAYRRFVILLGIIFFLSGFAYALINTVLGAGKGSADYPANKIAQIVTTKWHNLYRTKLKYVAGSRYTAGYIAFNSADHPKVFAEWQNEFSPGVSAKDVRKYGAVFVSDGYYGTKVFDFTDSGINIPKEIKMQYPRLEHEQVLTLPYYRNKKTHETMKITLMFLPPADRG
jgi:4-amino-4-deoxy-L-arabinose transferase-like glycosyltransferase